MLVDRIEELSRSIKDGGVVVLKTDTIYGIVASAKNESSVERIFDIKGRRPNKPLIVLIDNLDQVFEPISSEKLISRLRDFWPGPYSVIVKTSNSPEWLTRGSGSIAYRMPDDHALRRLIREAGPLVAPSANPEGYEVACDVKEAKDYFGDSVDIYVDDGRVDNPQPSSLISINDDGSVNKLR